MPAMLPARGYFMKMENGMRAGSMNETRRTPFREDKMANIDIKKISAQIKARKPIDDAIPAELRIEAAAAVIEQAGKAVAPHGANPRSTLKALVELETAAAVTKGAIILPWLALRALDLKPGEAVSGSETSNFIASAFIRCGGYVITDDEKERVSGILGDSGNRLDSTISARGRKAAWEKSGVLVSEGGRRLLASDITMSPQDILAAIEAIPTRHASASAAGAAASNWLTYSAISSENRPEDGDALFESYRPRRMTFDGAKPHPTPIVESAALASVVPPVPHYKPCLPMSLMTSGTLSDVQIETIVYAGQAHSSYLETNPSNPQKMAPRQGFLIGHGTGLGKGRCIAGILLDNWNQGRRRLVWMSERHRHIKDARRDWVALGGQASDIIDLSEIAIKDDVPAAAGILFVSYALARSGNAIRRRLDQIIDWFGMTSDGVIVFDEAQNLRNAIEKNVQYWGGRSQTSQQGEMALQLQDRLPNARVVYASATSASDISSMGFAVRLGLWGEHTAFKTNYMFFDAMESGGLNALELVARDLKATGLFLAANLTFDGIEYERLEFRLTPEERHVQDTLATVWSNLRKAIDRAKTTTGVDRLKPNTSKAKTVYNGIHYHIARARFFQALIAAFNARPVIESIKQDLANGHSAVIQMTNTFEANANRAIENCDSEDPADIAATPVDILLSFIENRFPVVKHHYVRTGHGVRILQPMTDSQGNYVLCPQAVADRDRLIAEVKALKIPEGPFEQIFAAFGSEAVAEVSGRSRRLVPGNKPGTRVLEERGSRSSENDILAFQSDQKRILIFSEAGGTGSSYHADKNCQNKRLRRHYLLQPGWRADIAIQGLGRSNRSNQEQPPQYLLVQSDLWAARRMISTVAAGMQALGAITRGQRHAASQDLFLEEDNLESEIATTAWSRFLTELAANRIPNMTLEQFAHETCLPVLSQNGRGLATTLPVVKRFLNAMSGMRCDQQEVFGNAYKSILDEVRVELVREGKYDRGIETISPDSLIKLDDQIIYRCPKTGAATRLLKMLRSDKVEALSYESVRRTAARRRGDTRFVKSAITNRVACLLFPYLPSYRAPKAEDEVVVMTPAGSRIRQRAQIFKDRWVPASSLEIENLWNAEMAEGLPEEEEEFHVVTGTLLPIWDKLPRDTATVYRMTTDDGEHILGRTVSETFAENLVKRVSGKGMDPDAALDAIEQGNIATLANGWRIEPYFSRTFHQDNMDVELHLPEEDVPHHTEELVGYGVNARFSSFENRMRFFLPRNAKARRECWKKIVKNRQIDEMAMLNA